MTVDNQLDQKINRLNSLLDIEYIIDGEKNSPKEIRKYFKINRRAYQLFHSKEGFMHFRVTKNENFSDDDIYYQPNVVSNFIQAGNHVLELGCGQGANLLYLATSHPDAHFCGLDLFPSQPRNPPSNLQILEQDYSDLSDFSDNSFDVIYAIETLVHSSIKDHVFHEVYRLLKPNGVFIVYDYALMKEYTQYDRSAQLAISLISKGGFCALIESVAEWEQHFISSYFQKKSITDLSKETLPDLKRLERKADRILSHPAMAKMIFRTFPRDFVNNIIIGYLGYDSCYAGIITYNEWIFYKDGGHDGEG